jgi:hypothetical protein
VIIAEYVGRDPEGFHALVELAETAGIPVHDINGRLNFPAAIRSTRASPRTISATPTW